MLCRHEYWLISGQLLWSKEGADCNLLGSPAKMKVCWPEEMEPGVTPVTLFAPLALLEVLRRAHGTATSFPLLEVSLDVEEVADGVDVVALGRELELAEEPAEITAKSILPDDGLSTRSLIMPNVWP